MQEHNYDNCHNYTCRMRNRKDGYKIAIDEFAEKLKTKLVMRYGNATPTEQYVAMQVTDWCNEIAKQMKEKNNDLEV